MAQVILCHLDRTKVYGNLSSPYVTVCDSLLSDVKNASILQFCWEQLLFCK